MKRKIIVLIGLVLGINSCSEQSRIKYSSDIDKNTEYLVMLMGGQSNMVGQGKLSDLDNMKFENINYFNFGMTPDLKIQNDRFGPEVGISKELKENFPNKNFVLIKYAIGGASLLDWSPAYNKEKAKITGHPEFGNMYDSLLNKIESVTNGLNSEIVAFLWMQGERDARIPEAGTNYYDNFKLLIDSLRSYLDEPDLPIIFGKINPPKTRYPALDTVRVSQVKINKDLINTYLIDTENMDKWSDSVHYSSDGQLKLGQKFGEQLVKIIRN